MLAILTTHPIQYQVPLWQALSRARCVPFEVWYLTDHGVRVSNDREFRTAFAWDLDMLNGYPYRFLSTAPNATPASFWNCRLQESLTTRLRTSGVTALWVQGWQVAAYWQAVWAAKRVGVPVWLRGESNNLAPAPIWKRAMKSVLLGQLFRRVDHFLYIGSANRHLYESYGVPASRLHPGLYCVDNERFARQAELLLPRRSELRRKWRIPEDASCVLFCGKFIEKKRPLDVIAAVQRLIQTHQIPRLHILFVGSGDLGVALRSECHVMADAENTKTPSESPRIGVDCPPASFAGFLNQTEICEAYVAADCLVLPSDYGETWGLVVNEAMATGLPCILSDRCGAAPDLAQGTRNRVFPCGDVVKLANEIAAVLSAPKSSTEMGVPYGFSFDAMVSTVTKLSKSQLPTA